MRRDFLQISYNNLLTKHLIKIHHQKNYKIDIVLSKLLLQYVKLLQGYIVNGCNVFSKLKKKIFNCIVLKKQN